MAPACQWAIDGSLQLASHPPPHAIPVQIDVAANNWYGIFFVGTLRLTQVREGDICPIRIARKKRTTSI
jgi:hypothetical protein